MINSSLREILVSFLMVTILLQEMTNNILRLVIPVDNISPILILLLTIIVFFLSGFKGPLKIALFLFVILGYFSIAIFQRYDSTLAEYFSFFLVYGLSGLVCCYQKINVRHVFNLALIVIILNIVLLHISDFSVIEESGRFIFGYMLQPALFIVYIYFLMYLDKKNIVMLGITISLAIHLSILTLLNSGRGTIVCIIAFILLLLIFFQPSKYLKYIGVVITLMSILILTNIQEYLVIAERYFSGKGVVVSAVEKSVWLINNESLLHGREELAEDVFEDISFKQLILGRGIGEYETKFSVYSHNLIISVFTDFGILGILSLLYFFRILYQLLRSSENSIKSLLVILIANSVVKLLFSSTYWYSAGYLQ